MKFELTTFGINNLLKRCSRIQVGKINKPQGLIFAYASQKILKLEPQDATNQKVPQNRLSNMVAILRLVPTFILPFK